MNIHDKAHDLARALKSSQEFAVFKDAKAKIDNNPKNREIIEDYRRKQIEIQSIQLSGKEPETAKINQLKGLYEILMTNKDIAEYLNAELRLGQIMQDIYKILGESLGLDK